MNCDPTASRDGLALGILDTLSSLLKGLLLDKRIKMLVSCWIIGVVAPQVLEVTDFLSGEPMNTWDLKVPGFTQAMQTSPSGKRSVFGASGS